MAHELEWATDPSTLVDRSKTLKRIDTKMVTDPQDLYRASTAAIEASLKSTDEVVAEMKRWLRTGIAPDGTRMMTDEAWQWHQDYYHATTYNDIENECLPEGAGVDYHYWTCPYKAHIGDMNFVMMYPTVNFADGTHMPADRLREKTKLMKNIEALARKRAQVDERRQREKLEELLRIMADNRGHPLRKDGLYTKYFWRPFLKPDSKVIPTEQSEPLTTMDTSHDDLPDVVQEAREMTQ